MRDLVEEVFALKTKFQETCTLTGVTCPFKMLDYTNERNQVSRRVESSKDWDEFIKGLMHSFVEDVAGGLNKLDEGTFDAIFTIMHGIRLRRNFAIHQNDPPKEGRRIEVRHREADIGSSEPTSGEDWTKLQVGLLLRLKRAYELQVAELQSADETVEMSRQ